MEEFLLALDQLLSIITAKDKHVIITSNFKIDLFRVEDYLGTSTFFDSMSTHNLLPNKTRPTRITDHSATLIDNIFTNARPNIVETKIITSDISDHLPVLTCLVRSYKNSSYEVHRTISEEGKKIFCILLNEANWDPVNNACNNKDA